MGGPAENLAVARRYIKAIESRARGDEIAQFFAAEAVVEIFPSRFFPDGSHADLAGIRAAAGRGNRAMTRQKYEIKNELASGDGVALEIVWTGTLAVAFQSRPAGEQMRARLARVSAIQRRQDRRTTQLRLLRPLTVLPDGKSHPCHAKFLVHNNIALTPPISVSGPSQGREG